MASWAASLTAKELLAVVYYERIRLGGSTEEAEAAVKALYASPDLPANFTEGMTLEDVEALFATVSTEAGAAAPAG